MKTFLLPAVLARPRARFARAHRGLLLALLVSACGSDSADPPAGDGDGDDSTIDGNPADGQPGDGNGDGDGDGQPVDGQPGDGDGDGGFEAHDIAATEFCTELTTLLCESEQACCSDPNSKFASVDACVTARIGDCISDIQPAATDAKTGYSPSAAGEGLAALYAKLSTCDLTLGEWFVSKNDGLFDMFQGTVAAGGDCTPSGTTDVATVLSCQGDAVCQIVPFPTKGTCGTAKNAGEGCVTELECVDGLRCAGTLAKTCQQRQDDGSPCAENGDCSSLLCEGGLCIARTTASVYCFN